MQEIKTVLCPMDFSPISERELQLAIQICERFAARLVVQHDLENLPPAYLATHWMYSEVHLHQEEDQEKKAERLLQAVISKLPPSVKAEGRLTRGPLDASILFLAQKLPADLIVMATHGQGSLEHASITERVLVQSPCPVLTTQDLGADTIFLNLTGDANGPRQQVLIPVDFTMHSLAALEFAFRLMEILPITLNLVHVEGNISWDDIRSATHQKVSKHRRYRLLDAQVRLHSLVPTNLSDRVNIYVRLGATVEEICNYASSIQAGLIIMGIHPKGIIDKFLFGATSYGVLHHSRCPVLFVPERSAAQAGTREDVAVVGA
jgi:universal stress protein A